MSKLIRYDSAKKIDDKKWECCFCKEVFDTLGKIDVHLHHKHNFHNISLDEKDNISVFIQEE